MQDSDDSVIRIQEILESLRKDTEALRRLNEDKRAQALQDQAVRYLKARIKQGLNMDPVQFDTAFTNINEISKIHIRFVFVKEQGVFFLRDQRGELIADCSFLAIEPGKEDNHE